MQLAGDLLAWTQLLAFAEHSARRWEPKTPRLRLFTSPPPGPHRPPCLTASEEHRPWARLALTGWTDLTALERP